MGYDIDKILKALDASRQARAVNSVPQSPTSNNLDVARYILTHANIDWNSIKPIDTAKDRDSSGPSVISRIFDILSRPNYAVANFFKEGFRPRGTMTKEEDTPGRLLDAVWQGFSGKDKTTFSDVIETLYNRNPANYNDKGEITGGSVVNPVAKYGGGFLLDVALDPLSLVGPGALQKGAKALGLASRAEKLGAVPSSPQSLAINKLPKDLAAISGPEAKPVNPSLYYKSDQLPLKSSPPPEFTPLGGNPLNLPPKVTDVDIPYIKTSPEFEAAINKINAASKNQARRKYKQEKMGELEDFLKANPNASRQEQLKKLNLWMMQNFPTTDSLRFKEMAPDVVGPEPLGKPPVAEGVIKPAQSIIDDIQKGDPTTIAEQQISTSNRQKVIQDWGNIRASEKVRAQEIADQYVKDVLSQPNKFSKTASIGNPAQMANLATRINNFVRKVGKRAPGKFDAFRMLRAAEDRLIEQGYHPTFWDGSHIRPTDVIAEMASSADDIPEIMKNHLSQVISAYKNKDPGRITDPVVSQALENLRAKNAVVEAPKVAQVIDEASKITPVAEQVLSVPKYNEFLQGVAKNAEDVMNAEAFSKSATGAAKHAITSLFTPNKTTPLQQTYMKRSYIYNYVQNGSRIPWKPVQAAQTKGIEDELEFSYEQVAKQIGDGNKAVEGFMSRVATWWGQKDLRPEVLLKTAGAAANAAARAKVWNNIAKQYSPEELAEGIKIAQGKLPMGASTDRVQAVGGIFEKAIQNLFDSTGLTQEAVKGSTVAMRSGMTRRDLNKQLDLVKSPFKFEAAKFRDPQGVMHDLTQGTEWLKSWQFAHIDDPLEFMWKMETAVEQLMHKYAYMDELAARWGSNIKTPEFNTQIRFDIGKDAISDRLADGVIRVTKKGEPIKPRTKTPVASRLDGLYFPKEIAPQIHRSLQTWDMIYNPRSPLVRLMDRVTQAWKKGVTIYAPSHHIRNLEGDIFLSWLAGVNNPVAYTKAAKLIWSQRKRYQDLENVENLVGRDAFKNAMTRPGDILLHTGSGKPLTAEQVYIAAHSTGIFPHVNVIEELFGEPLFKGRLGAPLKGWAGNKVRELSENREHFVRGAHFIDYLMKSKETNLQKLFADASKEVRKWHPDGSDLTDFERNVLRRVFPFYSWTRKAFPLMLEAALTRPGKVLMPDKFAQAVQGMMGIDAPSRTDPFPYDQLFPDWIKEKGIGPIARHGMEGLPGLIAAGSRSVPGFTGEPSGYTVVNPSNPFIDLVAQFGGMGNPTAPLQGAGQLLHPGIRIPLEVMQGRTFNDVPIEPGRYTAENIPLLAMLSRVSNVGVFGPTERGEKEGLGNMEALLNLITALGIQGTGPYIKTSEFQERDRRRAANGK